MPTVKRNGKSELEQPKIILLIACTTKKIGCFHLINNLQICEKLYNVRFMLCLIFPYKEFFSSLQKLVDDSLE